MEKLKLDIQRFASHFSSEIGICYCNGSSSEYGVYKAWLNLNSVTRVYGNPSGTISGSATGPTTGTISVSNIGNGATNSINITTSSNSYTYNGNTVSGNGNLYLQKKYSGSSKYTTNGLYCQVTLWSANSGGDKFNSGVIRCNKAGSSSADDYVKTPSWGTVSGIPVGDSQIGIWAKVYADNSSGSDLRGVTNTFNNIDIQNNNASVTCTIQYKKSTDSTWTSVSGTSVSLSDLTPATVYQYKATLSNGQYSIEIGGGASDTFTTTPATPYFTSTPSLYPTGTETRLDWSQFTTNISCTASITLYQGSTAKETKTITSSNGGKTHAGGSFTTGLTANTEYWARLTITNSTYTAYTNTKDLSATTYDYPKINAHTSTSSNSLDVQNSNTVYLTIYNPLGRQCQVAAFTASSGGSVIAGDSAATTHADGSTATITFSGTTVGTALGASGKTMNIYYRCIYGNSNKLYNSASLSITESFAKPILDNNKKAHYFYSWDSNTTTVSYTGNNQILLGNQSIPQYKMQGQNYFPFTAQYGANISKVEITCTTSGAGFTATTLTNNFTTNSNNIYVFSADPHKASNSYSSIGIKIKATDTRNFTNEYSTSITLTPTGNPIINLIKAQRQGGFGTTIEFTYSGNTVPNIEAGTNPNRTGLYDFTNWKLEYSTNGSSWSADSCTFNEKSATDKVSGKTDYDTQQAFLFRIKAQDKFGNVTYSNTFTVPMGEPTMFIDTYQNGVGINCFPQNKGLWVKTEYANGTQWIAQDNRIFDIIYPVNSIYMSTVNKNPADLFHIGTWEPITKGYVLMSAGSGTGYEAGTYKDPEKLTDVPQHNHTGSVTINSQDVTTSWIGDHSHTVNNHTHTQNGTFTTSEVGDHTHGFGWGSPYRAQDGSKWWTNGNSQQGGGNAKQTGEAGKHTHTVQISGETGGSSPGTTGAGGHSHTATHSHGGSITINSFGTQGGVNTPMPKRYVVYMWRRTE